MPKHLDDVRERLSFISANKTVLDMLLEYERTLDNADVYAYKNWNSGELVEGPDIERYWMTCSFMFPYSLMPDPAGAARLEKFGCKVKYETDIFKSPVKVINQYSYEDSTTKEAKLKKHKIWLVTIQMPKKFIDERLIDEIEAQNSINVDTSDLSDAYDANIDEVADMQPAVPEDISSEEEM